MKKDIKKETLGTIANILAFMPIFYLVLAEIIRKLPEAIERLILSFVMISPILAIVLGILAYKQR